jgi:hypothetical protein
MINKILTIVFTLVAIGIAYYLVDRIKFAIDEEERIATVERQIIDKLMFIREAEVAYKEANGQYTSDWNKLINFIDTGTIYITQKREEIKLLEYGAEETIIHIDTLDNVPVSDSLFSNPTYKKFQGDLENLSKVPVTNETFILSADKIKKGNVEVDVFLAEDPAPINPDRRGENSILGPLRVGSLTEVTIAGNWE